MKKIFSLILLILIICQLAHAILKIELTRELSSSHNANASSQSSSFLGAIATDEDKTISLSNYFQLKYFGYIYVGNKRQKMKVLFDTGSDTMWIGTTNCNNCKKSGLTSLYECTESDGCKSAGIPTETMKYLKGQVEGELVTTQVSLHQEQSSQTFTFNALLIDSISDMESYDADGLVGLTYQVSQKKFDSRDPFIKSLYQGKIISEQSFSIYLGFKKDDSEITFGGINQEKIKQDAKMVYYQVPEYQGNYWQVPTKVLKIGNKEIDISEDTTIVDSGTSVLCLTPSTLSQVEDYLKTSVKGVVKKDLLYTYTCGQSLPTIYITIESIDKKKYRYSIEEEYYSLKLNGDCTILLDSCSKNNILGQVFMRKYVTYFKYSYSEKVDVVGFAQSIANPEDNFLNDSPSDDSDKILYYILGGIGGAVLILAALLIYYTLKKRRTKKLLLQQKQEELNRSQSSEITQRSEKRISAVEIEKNK